MSSPPPPSKTESKWKKIGKPLGSILAGGAALVAIINGLGKWLVGENPKELPAAVGEPDPDETKAG